MTNSSSRVKRGWPAYKGSEVEVEDWGGGGRGGGWRADDIVIGREGGGGGDLRLKGRLGLVVGLITRLWWERSRRCASSLIL